MSDQFNKWFCFHCMSEHNTEESLQECRMRVLEEIRKMTKHDHRRPEFVRRWSVMRDFKFRS